MLLSIHSSKMILLESCHQNVKKIVFNLCLNCFKGYHQETKVTPSRKNVKFRVAAINNRHTVYILLPQRMPFGLILASHDVKSKKNTG